MHKLETALLEIDPPMNSEIYRLAIDSISRRRQRYVSQRISLRLYIPDDEDLRFTVGPTNIFKDMRNLNVTYDEQCAGLDYIKHINFSTDGKVPLSDLDLERLNLLTFCAYNQLSIFGHVDCKLVNDGKTIISLSARVSNSPDCPIIKPLKEFLYVDKANDEADIVDECEVEISLTDEAKELGYAFPFGTGEQLKLSACIYEGQSLYQCLSLSLYNAINKGQIDVTCSLLDSIATISSFYNEFIDLMKSIKECKHDVPVTHHISENKLLKLEITYPHF